MPQEFKPGFYRKDIVIQKVKALEDRPNGGFAGYASTFANVDLGGDKAAKGSYLKHLGSFLRDGFIAEGHDWNKLGIGFPTKSFEDDYGLYLEMEYHSDLYSQALRTKVNERIAAGKSVSLSVGYFLHDAKMVDGYLLLTEIELKEVSVVTVPMNPSAVLMDSKSMNLTLAEHGESLVSEVSALVKRLKDREVLRLKEARELSSDNVRMIDGVVEHIDTAIGGMKSIADELRALADRNRKGVTDDMSVERMRFELLKAQNSTTMEEQC